MSETEKHEASTALVDPPMVSGAGGDTGHLEELRTDPIGLMQRVRDECGDVGEFQLADKQVVLLTGPEANEWYFRAPEDDLDQAEAYPFMTPIFGEGVVFDAPPERRREMLHNQALRDKFMRGHAETIAGEVGRMVGAWQARAAGDGGTNGQAQEVDLLDWFAELTIYTSSACLIGRKFRDQLDRRFAELYHDLERGTDALAFVDPYAPIESFRRRDEARAGLVDLVQEIMETRNVEDTPPDERDLLDVLMSIREEDGSARFSADEVTGMFISMMFAGHHTTSGTAAWTLIELLRHPETLAGVREELAGLYAAGHDVSYQALREMPLLESAVKEALRLHPPLILLLRVAKSDLVVGGHRIAAGKLVGASPAVSNRLPEVFPEPGEFRPERYLAGREEDVANPWSWIPFGAGRHRCVGAAFAMMQLKAIFSVLLHDWDFQLAQPSGSYRNDHSKMVVQLAQPCVALVRDRQSGSSQPQDFEERAADRPREAGTDAALREPKGPTYHVDVDHDLCQGHGVCASEAPEVFSVSKTGDLTILDPTPPAELLPKVEMAVKHCPTRALSITKKGD